MKTTLIFIYFFFFTFCFVNGQQPPVEKKWKHNFSLGYLNTKVKNENVWNDEALASKSKHYPVIGVELSKKIGNATHFFFGLSFEQYATVSESYGLFKSASLKIDEDGYYYAPYFDSYFTEERKVSLIGIPVGFRISTGEPQKTGVLIEAGIKPSLVLSSKLTGKGSYERKGYYADPNYINVFYILEDIDRLDYKIYSKNTDVELGVKSFLFNTFLAAGIISPCSDKTSIYLKGYFTTSIGDITNAENKDKSYESLLEINEEYKKTTLFGFGLVFGVMLK